MDARRLSFALILATTVITGPGCILGHRPTFVQRGTRPDLKTFYLDGAGNYGFGKETVPLGLADGGYQGHVEHYIWTTHLGTIMDQMWYSHNRSEGRKLARTIESYLSTHPGGQVNIIALSAGTGVATFALEELRPGYSVENAIMLSSSLSADYDLSKAIPKVNGGIYFFWSPKDPVLRGVVPILGTVDQSSRETPAAGLWGAATPLHAPASTRQLYRDRVRNVQWFPETDRLWWQWLNLRHAGSVSRDAIRTMVAPVLVRSSRPASIPLTPSGRDQGAARSGVVSAGGARHASPPPTVPQATTRDSSGSLNLRKVAPLPRPTRSDTP